MGIEWTFSYGSDYFILDFAQFVHVFLGSATIDNNNNNNKNIYLPPKNTSTVMLGTGDYVYSNSGNTY